MSTGVDSFRAQALMLRERCVEAHNRLINDSAYSAVGELARSLEPGLKLDSDSPRLRLLSSYTFWGLRDLGGSRRGFEKRLRRVAAAANQSLHRRLTSSTFGAWRCVEASKSIDVASVWEPVVDDAGKSFTAAGVFNGNCDPIRPRKGDIYAGWHVVRDETPALAFAFGLADEGATRLGETADDRGWHDDGAFQTIEYHRDVLTQALRPDWEQCGLEEHYFLPPAQRSTFPKKFRRSVIRKLRRSMSNDTWMWHLRLATAEQDWIEHEFMMRLDGVRRDAARSAGRFRGDRIEESALTKLVSDTECLELMGLQRDGALRVDRYPPQSSHRVGLLDLDDEWHEATGISRHQTISQVQSRREEINEESMKAFDLAVTRHRNRLRWVGLVEFALEHPMERATKILKPDYRELRKVITALFSPMISMMPISALLADRGRAASRIETALGNADVGTEPRRVMDLPSREYDLLSISGIGPGSRDAIEEALLETLLDWPFELERGEAIDEEAQEEIDAGLEELEGLFE